MAFSLLKDRRDPIKSAKQLPTERHLLAGVMGEEMGSKETGVRNIYSKLVKVVE
jgi:hypothetical protein